VGAHSKKCDGLGGGCTIPKKSIWPFSFIVANISLHGFVENPLNFGILKFCGGFKRVSVSRLVFFANVGFLKGGVDCLGGCTIPKKSIWPLSFIVANITLRGFDGNPLNFEILNDFAAALRGFWYREKYCLQTWRFENLKWGDDGFWGA
jgi:hypothetical protein